MPWHCRCRKLRLFCFAGNGMNKILTVVTAFSLALITCAAAAKSAAPVHVPLPRNNPLKQTHKKKSKTRRQRALYFQKRNCQALEGLWRLATTRAGVFKVASNFRRQGRRGK